ncbi:FAD:protein FMN transferase [Shewanella sp. JM162201]|uniref:FAD:protein FMN transferase n=1 Tax=Shewanella jiangmenensis TaxID=2837387 RepID=A0ABS5V7R9_9GAMM|nr:FAD:protein FMN transferase [Shewanella jiangmenensis]MBT1446000.1 FAD:protein FMN transferase [Shewanella jiangmenensis]
MIETLTQSIRPLDPHRVRFQAMASDCELLFIGVSDLQAKALAELAELAITEVKRIEAKYSRYLPGSELNRINGLAGNDICIDAETAGLLQFAADGYRLSGGLFDITVAPLQRLWGFGLNEKWLPTNADVQATLEHIGFERLRFYKDKGSWRLFLPAGMSLDFGGIAKEYAADRALLLMERHAKSLGFDVAVLVNLGGDIAASRYPWQIGVEGINPVNKALERRENAAGLIGFPGGGLATSGDIKRFLLVDGKRIGHILSPQTGYPVPTAPRSVTVLAPSASAAGMLSTLAMLKGEGAEAFLDAEGLVFMVQRGEAVSN